MGLETLLQTGGAKAGTRAVSARGSASPGEIRGQTARFGLVVFSSGVMRDLTSGGRGAWQVWGVMFQERPQPWVRPDCLIVGNSLGKWVLNRTFPDNTERMDGVCGAGLHAPRR